MSDRESVEATGDLEVTLTLTAPNCAWKNTPAFVNGAQVIFLEKIVICNPTKEFRPSKQRWKSGRRKDYASVSLKHMGMFDIRFDPDGFAGLNPLPVT